MQHTREISIMWKLYGKHSDKRCGDCSYLQQLDQYLGTIYKCPKFAGVPAHAEMWKAIWIACGLYTT